MNDRQPAHTKVQAPKAKNYKIVAMPNNISRILDTGKGHHALWVPLPLELGEGVARLIVFTTVENPYDMPDEYKRIMKLLKE